MATTKFDTKVVGVTKPDENGRGRQFNHLDWRAVPQSRRALTLVRQPENPYDPNAISVRGITLATDGSIAGSTDLGFIPAIVATELAPVMDAGATVNITAYELLGGTDGFNCGCRVYITADQTVTVPPEPMTFRQKALVEDMNKVMRVQCPLTASKAEASAYIDAHIDEFRDRKIDRRYHH